jgi:hypothetical protein
MGSEPSQSDQTVTLIGIAVLLLGAILYVGLGFAPDLPRSKSKREKCL